MINPAALLICSCLWVSYFATGFTFAFHDVNGALQAYDLRKNKPRRTWAHYLANMPKQLSNLFVLFPVCMHILVEARADTITKPFRDIGVQDAINLVLGYVIQQSWLFGVHYALHTPFLYKRIHKYHHVPLAYVHSLSAWTDAYFEYIAMELGSYVAMILLAPMHYSILAVYFVYLGFSSSVEHSGFYINATLDSRYHWKHHVLPNCNYAEWDVLDWMFGTLKM
ncbi:hypothetical protein HDU99_002302 [Rhizoclosmatium hyalinum]|nr:hypothetical protein HDU99_002302 [Rhizoclosmatium hyalinum]